MKKNVSGQSIGAEMITASDGTAFTGTVTVVITVDNGTQSASGGTAPAHEGNGYHSYSPTAGETNGDHIAFTFTGTGAIPVTIQVFTTFPQTVNNDVRLAANNTLLLDIPTVGEFNARTIVSANYALEATLGALNDVAATDIVSAGAITTSSGAVSNVTTTANLTTNNDKLGYAVSATGLDLVLTGSAFMLAVADDVWDEILTGATHNIVNSAGRRLRTLSGSVFTDGTAQSGGNNTIQLAIGDVAVDGQFVRSKVILTGGTGQGQENIITDSVASTNTLTVAQAWVVNPDNTTDYDVIPAQAHSTVRNGGYDNASVFVDTVNGVSGTQKGVAGTSTNPVNNMTDAYTIATQEMIAKFFIEPNSTITLPSDSTNRTFEGRSYNVAFNSADIDGSFFTGATCSGIATAGTGNSPGFQLCGFGTVTLPPCNGNKVGFFGTFTIGSEGSFTFGESGGVFDLPFVIDYGSGLNASSFFLLAWEGGGIEIQNAGAGTGSYKLDMHGLGSLIVNANCSATTVVELHGHIDLVNNASGITIDRDTNYDITTILSDSTAFQGADIAAILVDTGTTIPAQITALNDITAADVLAAGDIDGFSLEEAQKIELAALGGKLSGAATATNTIRAADDSKDRITATVDADGNRSAVTLDGSG